MYWDLLFPRVSLLWRASTWAGTAAALINNTWSRLINAPAPFWLLSLCLSARSEDCPWTNRVPGEKVALMDTFDDTKRVFRQTAAVIEELYSAVCGWKINNGDIVWTNDEVLQVKAGRKHLVCFTALYILNSVNVVVEECKTATSVLYLKMYWPNKSNEVSDCWQQNVGYFNHQWDQGQM